MPHLYNDQQDQIRHEIRRILTARNIPERLRELLEAKGAHDAEAWAEACAMGWPGVTIPDSSGGLGLGVIEQVIVAEECGRALFSSPFLATGAAVSFLLAAAGDPDGLLAGIAEGTILPTLAFAEDSEPLPQQPRTRFTDGKVSGTKTAILGAAAANRAVILASEGAGAAVLVLARLDHPGVHLEALDTIDNSRCLAHLTLEDVPAQRFEIAEPMVIARQALGRLALFLASEAVGGTDACIALSIAYANERQAFGQAIGKFQAVKHGIAEMFVLNELARASVLEAAVRSDAGEPDTEMHIAIACLNAMQAYGTAAAGATQIHGGLGVTWEADLHLHYRRARALALEAGPPAFWEDLIVEEAAR